jgi:hypothetical protein
MVCGEHREPAQFSLAEAIVVSIASKTESIASTRTLVVGIASTLATLCWSAY